jgi:hypothetical protein
VHSRALLVTSFTGRVISDSSDDNDDLNRSIVTALTASDSAFLNKLMLEMPWLLSCSRNRVIAGSTRQLPIPNIIFHAYKVCQLTSLHEQCSKAVYSLQNCVSVFLLTIRTTCSLVLIVHISRWNTKQVVVCYTG